jgi:DNA-binding transcriptional regulator YiaG
MTTPAEHSAAIIAQTTATTALTTSVNTLVTAVLTQQTGIDANSTTWNAVVSDFANYVTSHNLVQNIADIDKIISTLTQTALNNKQDALVSGTNIVTINGSSLLQSGDLAIVLGATTTVSMEWEDRLNLRTTAATEGDSIYLKLVGKMIWQAAAEYIDDSEICFVTTIASVITGQWVLRTPAYEYIELNRHGKMNVRDLHHNTATGVSY